MKSLRYSSLKSFVNHFDLPRPALWNAVFRREAPLEVEIGFGTGEYLVRIAGERPGHNFVGIEENVERIYKTLRKIESAKIQNVRLLHVDARLVLERFFPSRSVAHIHCLFPCPWPKKNQVKHRLFSRDFLKLLNHRLVAGGRIDLVTDHGKYAEWVRSQAARSGFKMDYQEIPARYNTKFERKWREAGQEKFHALTFVKTRHIARNAPKETVLKVYFFEHFDPAGFRFDDQKGTPAIILKEFFFDEKRTQGMAHLLVAEDYLQQHVWVKIVKTAHKGWCLAVADGALVIPTAGVAKAMEALYQCAKRR